MQYKSDWEKYEHFGILPLSPIASFRSPLENERDVYQENIGVYIQHLPSDYRLQHNISKYIDYLMRSALSSSSFNIQDLPLDYISLGNGWHLLLYPAEWGSICLGVIELWKVVDDRIYRIEFLYEGTKFDEYKPILLQMLGSINDNSLDSYENFLTYEDPSSEIRIQHPFDWEIQPYNLNALRPIGKIVEFGPLLNTTDPRGFSDARVTIATNESKSYLNISIDKVADNIIETYQKKIPNFNLLEMDDNASLSGFPAFKLIFTLNLGDIPFRVMIIGAVLDDTLYMFDYISPSKKFDTYLSKVTHMIESFKIGLES